MVRASEITLPLADQYISRRRRHRFAPSVAGSASCLEDRVLLSGAGAKAHAAEVAKPLADTAAGRQVTAAFDSILGTNPTNAQMTQWVHRLHGGMTVKVMRKDLALEAQAKATTAGAIAHDPVIMGPSTTVGISATNGIGTTSMTSLPSGLSGVSLPTVSPVNLLQTPAGLDLSRIFTTIASSTPTSTTTTTGLGTATTGTTSTNGTTSANSSALTSLLDELLTGTTGTTATASSSALTSLLSGLTGTTGTTATGTTATGTSSAALTTLLDELLTGTAGTTPAGTMPSALTSLLDDLVSLTGTTSTATGTSPLLALLTGGSVPTPGTTSTTTSTTTSGSIGTSSSIGTIGLLGPLTPFPVTYTPVTTTGVVS
jgi:hypothetical protein